VRRKFNFINLRNAAITKHQVCTKEDCPPYHTEIYGRAALDLIWGGTREDDEKKRGRGREGELGRGREGERERGREREREGERGRERERTS
jgi:hypothetical protein